MTNQKELKENVQKLTDYIKSWDQAENPKPKNEDVFIDAFIYLLDNLEDDRDITFDGDNAYDGKQVTLALNRVYTTSEPIIYFEIAYGNDMVKVYTANHHGFWVPEYLRLDIYQGNKFQKVKTALDKRLRKVFGL